MNAPTPEKLEEAVMRKLCDELDHLARERARIGGYGARPPSNWLVRLIGDLVAPVIADIQWCMGRTRLRRAESLMRARMQPSADRQ